jgi:hypothetical protein
MGLWAWSRRPENTGPVQFWAWAIGIIGSLVTIYIWPVIVPPITKVCRSQFEGDCPPHDTFLGCGTLEQWSPQACWRFKFVARDSDVPMHQCGVALYQVRCGKPLF